MWIQLDKVTVDFPLYEMSHQSLKKTLMRVGGNLLSSTGQGRVPTIRALEGITLNFKKGDRVGLIGSNGAGKSTLLRVLAGIYQPTSGDRSVSGKIMPLLDINLGIQDEMTGYENIFVRGLLLGFSKKAIRDKIEDIAEFSELGDYLNVPLRVYSEGMKLRLAFSIATSFSAEILLMDESILVGDERFLEKARKRVIKFVEESNIFVIASHSREIVREFCNQALLLHRGKIHYGGSIEDTFHEYEKRIHETSQS